MHRGAIGAHRRGTDPGCSLLEGGGGGGQAWDKQDGLSGIEKSCSVNVSTSLL